MNKNYFYYYFINILMLLFIIIIIIFKQHFYLKYFKVILSSVYIQSWLVTDYM